MTSRRRIALWVAVGTVLGTAATVVGTRAIRSNQPVASSPPGSELLRSELELIGGKLHARGSSETFTGKLIEDYGAGRRKLEIEICEGLANGLSRGWFANGQMEVEETFLNGVSNGPRTRWHENGERRSLATIEDGQVVGEYLEWYDNGQMATKMSVDQGQPADLVVSWHPSGALKSKVRFENGEPVSRQFFDDSTVIPDVQRGGDDSI